MKYIRPALVLALCMILALPALGEDGFPKTIVDSADRTVTIEKPVERIVPIISWSYEPVWILGLKDKVVGVTTTAKEPTVYSWLSGIEAKQSVGTYGEPDYEKIIELHPDLVIAGRNAGTDATDKLEPAGITVVYLNFNDPTTFDREFKILASITGTDDLADGFLQWKRQKTEAIASRTSIVANKIDVYPNWCDSSPLLSASNGSGIQEVIEMAGGVNIASGLANVYPVLDAEWIVKKNPEVIIVGSAGCKAGTTGYYVDDPDEAKKLIGATSNAVGLNQTVAVKTERVFVLDSSCEEAVRGFVGIYYLAKWLYPDRFKDLDPEAIHKEYFETWLGIPYAGIWAYPRAI